MIILIRIILKSVGFGFVTIYPYLIIFLTKKSNSDWNLESDYNFWRKAFRKEWKLVIDFAVELTLLSSCFLCCYQMTFAFLHTMPGKPRWLAQWSLVLFKPVFGNVLWMISNLVYLAWHERVISWAWVLHRSHITLREVEDNCRLVGTWLFSSCSASRCQSKNPAKKHG